MMLNNADYYRIVDSVPETALMGIVVVKDDGYNQVLRTPIGQMTDFVAFQVGRNLTSGGSPGSPTTFRDSLVTELTAAGASCTGAVVSGAGILTAAAAAPETGGLSVGAAIMLWGPAVASTVQCSAGLYRVANVLRNRESTNKDLDDNIDYKMIMRFLDVIALLGTFNAATDWQLLNTALKEGGADWRLAVAGLLKPKQLSKITIALKKDAATPLEKELAESWWTARAGQLSPQQIKTVKRALEAEKAKRLSNPIISRLAKQRILDAIANTIGMTQMAFIPGGLTHDIAVWIVSELNKSVH